MLHRFRLQVFLFLTTSAPGLTSMNYSSSCPEDREASLRRTIKTLEKELSKKDKQLREFCDAATDLHHNMEEQEGALTNQLLRHQETIRMQHSHGLHHVPLRREHVPPIHPTHPPSVRNVSISPTRTTSPSLPQHHHNHQHQQHPSQAQTHLLGHGGVPYVNSNTGSRSVSPGLTSDYLTDANGTKDWKAMYLEAEKRCQMLQHAIEKMQSEVYLHRTRARKMLESVTKPKEVIALAEIRAENIVDRKLHSMSRYRSGSISSTSSMSECESTTPRERGDGMTAALRAHTRTLLTSSVPLMNSPSTGSVCTGTNTAMNGNPCETGTLCGSLCSAMVSGNANSVQPLFNTMREEISEELRDTM